LSKQSPPAFMGGAEPGVSAGLLEDPSAAEGALEQELLEDPAEVGEPLRPNMLPRPRPKLTGGAGVPAVDGVLEVVLVVDPGLGAVPGAQVTVCGVEPMAAPDVEGVVTLVAAAAGADTGGTGAEAVVIAAGVTVGRAEPLVAEAVAVVPDEGAVVAGDGAAVADEGAAVAGVTVEGDFVFLDGVVFLPDEEVALDFVVLLRVVAAPP
jgi:hypothetical protein